jgi:hypothetical protein
MDYGTGWGDPAAYGVAKGWELVGPDRKRKNHFLLRCIECGSESSYVKYNLGNPHDCWDCYCVNWVIKNPHIWPRLAPYLSAFDRNGLSEIEELERMYSL